MWHDLVPLAGMATGLIVTVVLTWGMVSVFRGPLGQALARRLGGHADSLEDEVFELRDTVAALSDDLRDMQERIDFAERLLTEATEGRALVSGDTGVTPAGGTHE